MIPNKTPEIGDKIIFSENLNYMSHKFNNLVEGKIYTVEEIHRVPVDKSKLNDLDSTIDSFDGMGESSYNTYSMKLFLKLKNVKGLFATYWFHYKKPVRYSSSGPRTEN